MIARIAAGPVLVIALSTMTAPPAGADPACGTVVTTSVTLTADLVCTGFVGPALVVGADRITIDLGGHTIASGGAGVENPGHDDVVVRNGQLATEGAGIWYHDRADRGTITGITGHAMSPAILLIEDSRRVSALDNDIAGAVSGSGIVFARSDFGVARDNRVIANISDGIALVDSSHVSVEANTSQSHFGSGISIRGGRSNVVRSNTVFNNDDRGIAVFSGTRHVVQANTIFHNFGPGVFVAADATRTLVDANDVTDHFIDGIRIENATTVLSGNVSTFNGGWGIFAVSASVDRGGNTAFGNVAGDCFNVVCGASP